MQIRSYINPIINATSFLRGHIAFQSKPLTTIRRLLVWRIVTLLRKTGHVRVEPFGVPIYLPLQWRGAAKVLFVFREQYDPELAYIHQSMDETDVFIDVGANIGIYSTIAASRASRGKVIAIEPTMFSFECLVNSIESNQFTNVTALNVAIGNCEGEGTIVAHNDSSRNMVHISNEATTDALETVRIVKLDNLIQSLGIKSVNWIKIDVEGQELSVLQSASVTITRDQPKILVEHLKGEHVAVPDTDVGKFLINKGYHLYILNTKGDLEPATTFMGGGNIVALSSHQ